MRSIPRNLKKEEREEEEEEDRLDARDKQYKDLCPVLSCSRPLPVTSSAFDLYKAAALLPPFAEMMALLQGAGITEAQFRLLQTSIEASLATDSSVSLGAHILARLQVVAKLLQKA